MLTNKIVTLKAGPEQLSLELYFAELAKVVSFSRKARRRRHLARHDTPDQHEWTDEQIATMREVVLVETLKGLTDGRSSAVKTEALEWVKSDDEHPFSFSVCCAAQGLDHEEIRSRVLYMVKKVDSALESSARRAKAR